ncbi:MAG: methylated-DNA--[protein]-cysteine S-methyltransferase [Spirochaetia bacterium]|nr:methylated-DNA--[protein]-cysteine S-methyltransferase [Spirochaetia bacterium]
MKSPEEIISIVQIISPLGVILAGATKEGVCFLEFSEERIPEEQSSRLRKWFGAELIESENIYLAQLNNQLNEYFNRRRKQFDIPLVLTGTLFQKSAWQALQNIPYGQTQSYKQQAAVIGKPKAVRAVGTANGANRISIIIPCHRVIAENGTLAGYGGGIWRKQFLLDLEKSP